MLPPHRPFRDKPADPAETPVAARPAKPQLNDPEQSVRIPPQRIPLKRALKVVGGAGGHAGAQ